MEDVAGTLPGRPAPRGRSPRVRQIVAAARAILDAEGWEAVTMRAVAGAVGVRAPSLYKHVSGRDELCGLIVDDALFEMGDALHAALHESAGEAFSDAVPVSSRDGAAVHALLAAYRRRAVANPGAYRLATGRGFDRTVLTPGVEEWSGRPFWLVTGDPARAQALFGMAHGLVIMEIDMRLPPGDIDATWRAGGEALA